MSDNNTGSNNWNAWAKHVLSELERFAKLEKEQNNNIIRLDTRLTKVENNQRWHFWFISGACGIISTAALGTIAWLIVWFVESLMD